MTRIVFFALLLASLLTGAAFSGGSLASALLDPVPPPTIDAGCEADPNGRPLCTPGS